MAAARITDWRGEEAVQEQVNPVPPYSKYVAVRDFPGESFLAAFLWYLVITVHVAMYYRWDPSWLAILCGRGHHCTRTLQRSVLVPRREQCWQKGSCAYQFFRGKWLSMVFIPPPPSSLALCAYNTLGSRQNIPVHPHAFSLLYSCMTGLH